MKSHSLYWSISEPQRLLLVRLWSEPGGTLRCDSRTVMNVAKKLAGYLLVTIDERTEQITLTAKGYATARDHS